ncbi:MAG TPA: hypothetical protein VLF19_09690 [Methylomirabilota bacterium]|nr:hypothetical protein [Methylomirabilota bacterium]
MPDLAARLTNPPRSQRDAPPRLGTVEALLLGGLAAEALTWAEHALAVTRQRGERGHEALAVAALAGAHAALDDPARAERCYRDGPAESLEMRPVMARCHFGLGRLQRALGPTVAGGDSLARAAQLFTDMGAPGVGERDPSRRMSCCR